MVRRHHHRRGAGVAVVCDAVALTVAIFFAF
jgi:hypothetical protein